MWKLSVFIKFTKSRQQSTYYFFGMLLDPFHWIVFVLFLFYHFHAQPSEIGKEKLEIGREKLQSLGTSKRVSNDSRWAVNKTESLNIFGVFM